jgi:hypothetical protein
MRPRSEEEPEPIIVPEPDEDPGEPDDDPAAAAGTGTMVPRVDSPSDREREYEYRVDVVSLAEVLDGTMAEKLGEASHDDWQLVDIIDAGDKKALLLRKRKQKESSRRPVGFAR